MALKRQAVGAKGVFARRIPSVGHKFPKVLAAYIALNAFSLVKQRSDLQAVMSKALQVLAGNISDQ